MIVPTFGDHSGSKAVSVFTSGTDRFRSGSYVGDNKNPGPMDYDAAEANPKYMIKGPIDTKFGTVAERNSLL